MSRPSRNATAFPPSRDPPQIHLQHALEEMSRQKGIVDSMQNGLRVYEAFTQALKKENEAHVVEIAKLKAKVKDLSKRRDGESTLTEPMTEENFLGHEDTNPKDFVNRLVDKITDICLSKAEQSNWDGPDLLNRIMQDRRLVKERKDNPWCNFLEYKAYKERVAYVDEDTEDELDGSLSAQNWQERQDRCKEGWRAKTQEEKDEFEKRWREKLKALVRGAKIEDLTDRRKATKISEEFQGICSALTRLDTVGMKGCILMIPDYFTKGSTPKYFGTSAILNAAIFKKVIPRNIGSEEALMDTLWAGFRYFASEHYGEDEMAREIARQVSGKKASEVFSSCVEIIIEELNEAGVPEELLNPKRMSWKKLYDICATHKVGYRGIVIEFRWRDFREKDKLWYGKNKNLFLGRKFEAYALSEDKEEDIDILRRLKSCAKAQAVFDDGGGRDETQNWKLWEAERGREYKRLGGINEALYHVEEISLNQQGNAGTDAQSL